METGRPIETPEARYGLTGRGVWLAPPPGGAHNWRPMSWNPSTGLVYLPAQNNNSYYEKLEDFEYTAREWNTGTARGPEVARPPRPELSGPRAVLLGWDPVENREVWRMEGVGRNGGTLSTAGNLVFRGSGDRLTAHDAQTGEQLWEAGVGDGTATPVTYELDGRQYLSILAGTTENGPPRMWTFVLDGAAGPSG